MSAWVIAIDGPAAAGKGTLARHLATAFDLPYLDTGLLYRGVGRRVLDNAGDPTDPDVAEAAAKRLQPADLGRLDLRGPEADQAAAQVAAIPGVRAALLEFQRRFATQRGAVLDGRDIGTVVFPRAPVKLFVTASLEARARRRWLELQAHGAERRLEAVMQEMQVRDAMDAARAASPLRPAEDAVLLDTTSLDARETFEFARNMIEERKRLLA